MALKTVVQYWDTPYPVLENDHPTGGIPMWIREPRGDGTFSLRTALQSATLNADASGVFDDDTYSKPILIDDEGNQKEGRVMSLINYWAGGAPNWHGASVQGKVAYHFRLYLRAPEGRSWWSSADKPDFMLLAAGNGFMRVDKVVSGTVTTIHNADVTEAMFLESGLLPLARITTMQVGDYLDIYYVEDASFGWGGYVFKAMLYTDYQGFSSAEEAYRHAPVVCADMFDDSQEPQLVTLEDFGDVVVRRQRGGAATGEIEIPLANLQRFDAKGWVWNRDTTNDPGYLELYKGNLFPDEIHRKRLVRIKTGWTSPMPSTGLKYADTIAFEDDNWVLADTMGNGVWSGIDTTVSHDGDGTSLHGTVNGMGGSGSLTAQRTFTAADGVGPNISYTITAWANMTARPWFDAGMYLLVNGVRKAYSASGGWQQLTVVVNSTAASELDLTLVRNGGYPFVQNYQFWWDEIVIARTDTGQIIYPNPAVGYETEEIYTCFTGMIDDFGDAQSGRKIIDLVGFEQLVLDQHIKNYPDRISYMAANYRKRKGTSQPVYKTDAYDAWPMELVIRDLFVRAGVPESLLRQKLYVTRSDGVSSLVTYGSQVFQKMRARTMGGKLLRLERPVHYGNNGDGFDENKAPDDEYIFKPDNTKEIWRTLRDMTERYGYDLWMDEMGHVVLQPSNNPAYVDDLGTTNGSTQMVHPNAYAGTYQEWTGTPSITKTYTAARIDVILPRFVGAGTWSFTVIRASDLLTVSSGTLNPSLPSGYADEFFYDQRTTIDGGNTTVATLYSGDFDTYIVTLTTSGSATRRVDSFLLWHTDPLRPRFDHNFATQENAINIDAHSTMDEMRNLVLMVGRRKLTATDSTKLETNPNNPTYEFIVQAAVDVESIIDPTAPNFIGYAKETVVYDERITDADFAAYAANAFIFKYRLPKPSAGIHHTVIPILRLNEPLTAHEQTFESITADTIVWVTGFEHRLSYGSSTTDIQTTSYIPTASYEPREDIDIDANFGGNPVINVTVSYESLAESQESNVALGSAVNSPDTRDIVTTTVSVSGENLDMTGKPWPPVPGTVQLYPSGNADNAGTVITTNYTPLGPSGIGGSGGVSGKVMWNGSITSPRLDGCQAIQSVQIRSTKTDPNFPLSQTHTITLTTEQPTVVEFNQEGLWYYEFHEATKQVIAWRVNGPVPPFQIQDPYTFSMTVVWVQNTGASDPNNALMNNPYHHFFNVDYRDASPGISLVWSQADMTLPYQRNTSITSYKVKYRKFWPGVNTSDPYSGASPFYDPYSSELGKVVSVEWDQLVSGLVRISVVSVFDDTVVAYLTEPTGDPEDPEAHWTWFNAGANRLVQWDGVDDVGIWNKKQSRLWAVMAQAAFEQEELPVVGKGYYVWNREEEGDGTLGKLALISGLRDPNTEAPVFGHGTYACWKIKWEVLADQLGETPRTVQSDKLAAAYNGGDSSAVVYTHLPEPTHIEIADVADYTSLGNYNENNPPTSDAGFWQSTPTSDALIHNRKPVRIRYAAVERPGPQWDGNGNKAGFKLFELAHLRVHLFDQFMIFEGVNYPGSDVPKRTLVNRRLVNDEHSVLFQTSDWITGTAFKTVTGGDGREWVFQPKNFKKDFGTGIEEELRFMDYLQLEEVPSWDESRQIAGKSSRLHIAFMNYLFFLSTYTQDRSGRYFWAQNRKFLDRSKIIRNAYGYWLNPSNPDLFANASTYRTPWQDDMHYQHRRSVVVRQWQDEGSWRSEQADLWNFNTTDIGYHLLRHYWSDHDPAQPTINGVSWASFGLDHDEYSLWHADAGRSQLPSQYANIYRQLGTESTTQLGDWTWESAPIWVPCITRDFHPYFLVPPMPDMPVAINAPSDTWGSMGLVPKVNGDFNEDFIYLTVDTRAYNSDTNQGNDVAAAEVWNSVAWDMTATYDPSTDTPHVKFWPGTVVDTNAGPAKNWMSPDGTRGNQSNMFDYMRQDQVIHYEDLRGMFSRGPRPAEASKKVTPAGPYYTNIYNYRGFCVHENIREKDDTLIAGSPGYPKYRLELWTYTAVSGFFHMKFRHEYYWESGNLFPTDDKGVERLDVVNYTKSRIPSSQDMSTARFDDGAWTGWKDDVVVPGGFGDSAYRLYQRKFGSLNQNVFETGFMPIAVGPYIIGPDGNNVTRSMIFSMVLVNERREGAI